MPFDGRDLRDMREARTRLLDRPLELYDMVRDQAARQETEHFPALLCLAACRAVGGDKEQAVPAANGLDLAEAAFALHDRLGKGNLPRDLRRYGQPQAINAGDALFSLARLSLLDLEKSGSSPGQVAEALHLLDEACLCGGRGRFVALNSPHSQSDGTHLMSIAQDQDGALWGCAAQIGSMLGGASESRATQLRSFGDKLGTAHFLLKSPGAALREQVAGLYAGALAEMEASVPADRQRELRDLAGLAMSGGTRTDAL